MSTAPEASPLGKAVAYAEHYDPALLFPIPRQGKRAEIGIAEAALPISATPARPARTDSAARGAPAAVRMARTSSASSGSTPAAQGRNKCSWFIEISARQQWRRRRTLTGACCALYRA